MEEKKLARILGELQKNLMIYALSFTNKNEAEDLCQSTVLKIIENQDQFLEVENPKAYAKATMRNLFLDQMLRTNRETSLMVDVESNFSMESIDHIEHQLLLDCLDKQNEMNRTILAMLGEGYNYNEIQDFISDISIENLRVRAYRSRISLAECMGRDHG